jgi:hypothetical protein
MKYIFILITALMIVGCEVPASSSRMEGTPSNAKLKGYEEMCKREPESELCNE